MDFLAVAILYAILGLCICLVAHFYFVKSHRGFHHQYFYLAHFVFVLGLGLHNMGEHIAVLMWASQGLVLVGGVAFIVLMIGLYRSMMSIRR